MAAQPGSPGNDGPTAAQAPEESKESASPQPRVRADKWPQGKYTEVEKHSASEEAGALLNAPHGTARLHAAFAALICARQAHALAAVALSEETQRLAEGGDSSCAVEHVLRASAAQESTKPFERDDLRDRVSRWLLPFAAAEAHLEREQRDTAMAAEAATNQQQRQRRPLPMGVPISVDMVSTGSTLIERGSVVVLAGDCAATTTALAYLCVNAWLRYTGELRVAFLRTRDSLLGDDYSAVRSHDGKLAIVPARAWTKVDTATGMVRILDMAARRLRGNAYDAVVIEDYAACTGVPGAAGALPTHEQLRALRRQAQQHGAVIVVCVTNPCVDASGPLAARDYAQKFMNVSGLTVTGYRTETQGAVHTLFARFAPEFGEHDALTLEAPLYTDPQLYV